MCVVGRREAESGDGFFYDGDGCLFKDWDVFSNAIDTVNSSGVSIAHATLFFRKLIMNDGFMEQFIGRFMEMVSNELAYDNTYPYLTSLVATMKEEVPNQSQRFGFPVEMSSWENDLECIDAFLKNRPDQVMEHLVPFFDSVMEKEKTTSDLYPNPSTRQIHVCFLDERELNTELCIFDLIDRCVYRERLLLLLGFDSRFACRRVCVGVSHLIYNIARQ